MKSSKNLTILTVAVVAVILLAAIIIPRLGGNAPAVAATEFDYAAQPVAGSLDAPVRVALFFDFLCPHCADFGADVTPVLKREFVDTGIASLSFFNFPVVDAVRSRALAIIGECVFRQSNEAFVTLEPILLRSQAQTGPNTNRAVTLALDYNPGLDATALNACVSGSETAANVDADVALARALNLGGTPSVLVDGVLVANPTLDNIRRAIQAAAN